MRPIDADAMLDEAKRLSGPQTGDGWDNWGVYALIGRQPTIDAVPAKHGVWEYIGGYGYQYRCSECVMCAERKTNYCPYCGAKMC